MIDFEKYPELQKAVIQLLATLTPREEKVVKMLFDRKTTKEIAKHFDVSEERILQIKVKACRKLRHPSRQALLDEVWRNGFNAYLSEIQKYNGVKSEPENLELEYQTDYFLRYNAIFIKGDDQAKHDKFNTNCECHPVVRRNDETGWTIISHVRQLGVVR